MCYRIVILLLTGLSLSTALRAADNNSRFDYDYDVIQLYTQNELNNLINKNLHLIEVVKDDCQLVQDIEAHALKIKEPAYVYLWGDMLTWGVCVERDATLGMHYIEEAAKQGLLAAIEQLGRYYENGTLVLPDKERATVYYREAALQGFLNAKINYVRMLNDGYGSPVDYEDAYNVLFHSIIVDQATHQQVQNMLATLGSKMPEYIVRRAKIKAIL